MCHTFFGHRVVVTHHTQGLTFNSQPTGGAAWGAVHNDLHQHFFLIVHIHSRQEVGLKEEEQEVKPDYHVVEGRCAANQRFQRCDRKKNILDEFQRKDERF